MNKPLRIIRAILLNVGALAGAITLIVVAVCLVFGLRPVVVVSGSMEPALPVGSLALTRSVDAKDVAVDDVVTVARQDIDGLITHRVTSVEPWGSGVRMTLKGDANDAADPNPYDVSRVGLNVAHIPLLGYLAHWIKGSPLLMIAILIGMVVLVYLGGRAPRGGKGSEAQAVEPDPEARPDAPPGSGQDTDTAPLAKAEPGAVRES